MSAVGVALSALAVSRPRERSRAALPSEYRSLPRTKSYKVALPQRQVAAPPWPPGGGGAPATARRGSHVMFEVSLSRDTAHLDSSHFWRGDARLPWRDARPRSRRAGGDGGHLPREAGGAPDGRTCAAVRVPRRRRGAAAALAAAVELPPSQPRSTGRASALCAAAGDLDRQHPCRAETGARERIPVASYRPPARVRASGRSASSRGHVRIRLCDLPACRLLRCGTLSCVPAARLTPPSPMRGSCRAHPGLRTARPAGKLPDVGAMSRRHVSSSERRHSVRGPGPRCVADSPGWLMIERTKEGVLTPRGLPDQRSTGHTDGRHAEARGRRDESVTRLSASIGPCRRSRDEGAPMRAGPRL